MASFSFELVSPERLLVSEEVDEVVVPGVEGEFTVLAGHAPFITVLRPGIVTIRKAGSMQRIYVRGGFAEVNPGGLTILADTALPVEDLDAQTFGSEIAAAESAVAAAGTDDARRRAEERLNWLSDLRAGATAH